VRRLSLGNDHRTALVGDRGSGAISGAASFYGTDVQSTCDWPAAEPLETARLVLEPLCVAHAGEMVFVLGDRGLYEGYGQHKAEKSISRLEWFAANCGTGALGLPAGRAASVM
jgi:hypothetical protein